MHNREFNIFKNSLETFYEISEYQYYLPTWYNTFVLIVLYDCDLDGGDNN